MRERDEIEEVEELEEVEEDEETSELDEAVLPKPRKPRKPRRPRRPRKSRKQAREEEPRSSSARAYHIETRIPGEDWYEIPKTFSSVKKAEEHITGMVEDLMAEGNPVGENRIVVGPVSERAEEEFRQAVERGPEELPQLPPITPPLDWGSLIGMGAVAGFMFWLLKD